MSDAMKINPYPRCRGEAKAYGVSGSFVSCENGECELIGPLGKDEAEAVALWNRLRLAPEGDVQGADGAFIREEVIGRLEDLMRGLDDLAMGVSVKADHAKTLNLELAWAVYHGQTTGHIDAMLLVGKAIDHFRATNGGRS